MAQRRMFSKEICTEDSFITLSYEAIVTYIYLALNADDDGFVSSPVMITRSIGTAQEDIQDLADAGYVIDFGNGILLIRHWHIHNYIQSDRYHETIHLYEKSLVDYDEESKIYDFKKKCIQDVSADKDSIEEYSKDKDRERKVRRNKDSTDLDEDNLGDIFCRVDTGRIQEFDGDF